MKYTILQTTRTPAGLLVFAQPVTGRGAVARGGVALIVRPGLLAASLAYALKDGETWELTLAADGETIIEPVFKEEEREVHGRE